MSFTPLVPLGGLAGLAFLDRTMDRQVEAFSRRPDLAREIDHFLANAGRAETAEAFVADRRSLRVALGAFGLASEADKTAFVRTVLEEGTEDPRALANRLSTPGWRDFAAAMGFGDGGARLSDPRVRAEIADRYRIRQFEEAVGARDAALETALAFRRGIAEIAASPGAERSGWLKVMGRTELRQVVEAALGLPSQFGALDLERQREELAARASARFGGATVRVFEDAEVVDEAVRRFLLIDQARRGPDPTTPGATALAILKGAGPGAATQAGLFASRLL